MKNFIKSFTFLVFLNFFHIHCDEYEFVVLDSPSVKLIDHEVAVIMHESYREYPYLLVWNTDEYQEYVDELVSKKNLVLVAAKVNNQIVGIVVGFPLVDGEDIFTLTTRNSMNENGFFAADYFYLAETVIKKTHRKKGLVRPMVAKCYEAVEG